MLAAVLRLKLSLKESFFLFTIQNARSVMIELRFAFQETQN